ncbi:MAG TPA: sn-glycerol-3-phosphate ABC transporter ATP-binding protein UgpC [Candidatus Saccharimonadaceae bacterium]|jgi:multiple sugar transport system ATP-binding protein|nr:sn-glycerol-3-phosphate ABC transporter ATP-binding protein UgpC [Candidatus Saccharimonadaceae bacterium]
MSEAVSGLELIDVGKSYGAGSRAVDHVSLRVDAGEFLVLVGPSGCGKSTILRMIAGLEDVTDGQIKIGERVVNEIPPRDRDIAMVFQNYALYPHLSVYENLAFGLRRRKVPAPDIDRRVREAAGSLGLERYLERRPRALSGGERQRVALGRAMVREPRVFLFDEPLSNLDARLRVQMRAEIKRLHQRVRATMVYVTHDQVEAMTLGDRIAVLKSGHLQQVADPFTLYEKPANQFVAGFIGSPPINLFAARVSADAASLEAGGERWTPPPALQRALDASRGREIQLGVRPEDVRLEAGAPGLALKGRLEMAEPLGSETLAYWATEAGTLVSRLPGARAPRIGEPATLHAAFTRLHAFEAESGRALAGLPLEGSTSTN